MSCVSSSAAFPYQGFYQVENPEYGRGQYSEHINVPVTETGMNKREYFAALAMQGFIACNASGALPGIFDVATYAVLAVSSSDALIIELSKDYCETTGSVPN